jgi:ketosteroid isomerase-like protein
VKPTSTRPPPTPSDSPSSGVRRVSEESTTPDLEEAGRRLREALNRGDLDAAVALYAPDAVWDVSLLGLEGVFEGREAIGAPWMT